MAAVQGWFLSFNANDRAISRRRNRSFTEQDLKRPLDHIDQSLGMSAPQASAPAQHMPNVGYYYDPDGFNFANSNGQLALGWTDENGESRQLLYDSTGMRWDGNSVEGQSDIGARPDCLCAGAGIHKPACNAP